MNDQWYSHGGNVSLRDWEYPYWRIRYTLLLDLRKDLKRGRKGAAMGRSLVTQSHWISVPDKMCL